MFNFSNKVWYITLVILFLGVSRPYSVLSFYTNFSNKVLLKDIQELNFEKNTFTKVRRLTSLPQLTCVGKCEETPSFINCVNVGYDGFDVIWKCSSDGFVFNRTVVSCEGYDNQNDLYVVKGSCRIRYSVESHSVTQKLRYNYYQISLLWGFIMFGGILGYVFLRELFLIILIKKFSIFYYVKLFCFSYLSDHV
jgi:hypothetical protein